MGKIFITGDTHTASKIQERFKTKNFPEGKELTKEDVIIITGDFGLVFFYPDQQNIKKKYKKDQNCLKWLDEKPWTTLFVDGNHENFTLLNELPIVDKYEGKVGKVNNSVFHLKRGEIYKINGKSIFTFGGAETEEKNPKKVMLIGSRIKLKDYEYQTYWKEEIPSNEEYEYALNNLKLNNFEVDYIITHTTKSSLIEEILTDVNTPDKKEEERKGVMRITDKTAKMIETIYSLTTFKIAYFGHFHIDKLYDKNKQCLEKEVIEIGETT